MKPGLVSAVWLMVAIPCPAAIDFEKQIRPILSAQCILCHSASKAAGGLRLNSRQLALKGGAEGPAIVVGQPEKSPLFLSIEKPASQPGAMPPGGPQLKKEHREAIRQWILEGAIWPESSALSDAQTSSAPALDEKKIVERLRTRITANSKEKQPADMKPYKAAIPGTDVAFEMIPIPGGEFVMGTPPSEAGRRKDEGPQHKVRIDPFWMGKHEVTWDEYRLFMFARQAGETVNKDALVDAVSRPTRPYVEMSFGMGINGFPAISMTQHAANKYAEWLSAKTGHFYRLPTEAEWEYACRAGTTSAYSFGDDAATLSEYAWYADNSNGKYQQVGKKKPNPWGLHDMHGNVVEWTLDQYSPDFYAKPAAQNPWMPSTQPYPHAVRGGSWNDDVDRLRCGARLGSEPAWKMQDPQLPKSIWYHTDAQWLGFRLVRPLKLPPLTEMYRAWNNGVETE